MSDSNRFKLIRSFDQVINHQTKSLEILDSMFVTYHEYGKLEEEYIAMINDVIIKLIQSLNSFRKDM